MMNFMELVQARESCRSYQDKPVTREQLAVMLRRYAHHRADQRHPCLSADAQCEMRRVSRQHRRYHLH